MDAPDRVHQKAKPPGRVCSCQSRPTLPEAVGFNLAGKFRTSRSWRVRDEALAKQGFDQDLVVGGTSCDSGCTTVDNARGSRTSQSRAAGSICLMFERLVGQSVILRG
jgi:hypothetical protein